MIIRNSEAEGQCYTHPAYGEVSQSQSTVPVAGTATYEALDLSSQSSLANRNRQNSDILNRRQANGNQK